MYVVHGHGEQQKKKFFLLGLGSYTLGCCFPASFLHSRKFASMFAHTGQKCVAVILCFIKGIKTIKTFEESSSLTRRLTMPRACALVA